MKIEILYPELCTLYGDKGNMQYLKLCLPDAEFVETTLNAKPLFLTEDIDLVYMCSMSEKSQEVILSRLLPLKEEIFRAFDACLLYTSPSPRDATLSRMPSSA